MADFSLNLKINGVDTAINSIDQLEAALSATKNELKSADFGSAAFNQAETNARKLDSTLKNIKLTTEGVNTKQLAKSFADLGQTVTGAFAVATNAAGLFGKENEDLAKAQVKAQQAIAIVLGARAIAEGVVEGAAAARLVVEKISAISSSLYTSLINQNTVAVDANSESIILNTSVLEGETAATDAAIVAQEGLNTAMKSNPIGALVAVLAIAVTALAVFSSSSEDATEDTLALNKALREEADLYEKQYDLIIQLIKAKGDEYISEGKNEKERVKRKLEVESQINSLTAESTDKQIRTNAEAYRVLLKQVDQFEKDKAETISKTAVIPGGDVIYLDEADKDAIRFNQRLAVAKKFREEEKKAADDQFKDEDVRQQKRIIIENQYQTKVLDAQIKFLKDKGKNDDDDEVKRLTALKTNLNETVEAVLKNRIELIGSEAKTQAEINNATSKGNDDATKLYNDRQDKIKAILEKDDIRNIGVEAENNRLELLTTTKVAAVNLEEQVQKEKLRILKEGQIKELEDLKASTKEIQQVKDDAATAENALTDEFEAKRKTAREEDKKDSKEKERLLLEFKAIQDAIQQEISFGDFNVYDQAKKLDQDAAKLKIEIKQKEKSLQHQHFTDLLDLQKTLIDEQIKIDIAGAEAKAKLDDATFEDNIRKKFAGVKTEKEIDDIIAAEKKERAKNLEKELNNIKDKGAQEKIDITKKSAEEEEAAILASVNKIKQITQTLANDALAIAQAINAGKKQQYEQDLVDLDNANLARQDAQNIAYNTEKAALDAQLKGGTLSKKEYDEGLKKLQKKKDEDDKAAAAKLLADKNAIRKKEFENDKKLKIASTVINTIMGSIAAFTGMAQAIPGPVGLILGGVAATAVTVAGAIAVANIAKTKFNEEKGPPTAIDSSAGEEAQVGGQAAIAQASSGGFTGFNAANTGRPGEAQTGGPGGQPQKVYVLESDITGAQRRVSVAESNATFG